MKHRFRVILAMLLVCIVGLSNLGCVGSAGEVSGAEPALSQNESIAQLDRLQDYFYEGRREHKIYPDYDLA